MNNQIINSDISIALNPVWLLKDFSYRSQQIYQQLKADNLKAIGLWLEDASEFACVLLACINANVKILLPPSLLAENKLWIEKNADLFLTSKNFSYYGNLQKVKEIKPIINKQSLTEIWLKTSGSSGHAKIIKKTAYQMWQEAKNLAEIMPFERGSHTYVIGSVSTQHLYGLTFRIFLPLEMNWTMGREQLQYPEYLISESNLSQKTIWISSPALLSRLNLENTKLSKANIIGIISAGGVLLDTTRKSIESIFNMPLIDIYGSTETGVIAFRQQKSYWLPIPNSKIGTNEQGALWVENSWISQREQTADVIEKEQEGFHLLGRIDRIIKLGDKRVSLTHIEQSLLKHKWVNDCYIAKHPQHQRPAAWVELNKEGISYLASQGRKAIISEFKNMLTNTQEKFALPRFWRFSKKLPRNSQSKISYIDFETIFLNRENEGLDEKN